MRDFHCETEENTVENTLSPEGWYINHIFTGMRTNIYLMSSEKMNFHHHLKPIQIHQ